MYMHPPILLMLMAEVHNPHEVEWKLAQKIKSSFKRKRSWWQITQNSINYYIIIQINSETDNEESKTVALPPTMTKDKNEVRIWLTALGTSRGFCFLSVYVQHVFTVLLCRHLFQYKTG